MKILIVILDKEKGVFLMMNNNSKWSLEDLFDDNNNTEKNEEQVLLEQYINKFGHGLPMELIPDTISNTEIFQKVKVCLESNQDTLLEMLGIEINETDIY